MIFAHQSCWSWLHNSGVITQKVYSWPWLCKDNLAAALIVLCVFANPACHSELNDNNDDESLSVEITIHTQNVFAVAVN